LVLVTLTLIAYFRPFRSEDSVDDSKFTLPLNTVITEVVLRSKVDSLDFQYTNGEWWVNKSFKMDQGMRDAFFTVVSSIRIKKPVGITDRDSIVSFLNSDGVEVTIINQDEVLMNYVTAGDELRSISYFMEPGEEVPYVVNLPGYDSYVAGIYSVPENDWKNRFIMEVDWSNLKEVGVEFINKPDKDFKIVYKDNFFFLQGSPDALDSASLFDYIRELTNFQVNSFIDLAQNTSYDSLIAGKPTSRLTVSLIGKEDQVLEIYPVLKGDRLQLGLLNKAEAVLINPRALIPLLKKKEDW